MYWVILVIGALGALFYVVMKIRHGQLATTDAVFWFFFAFALIVAAVFPQCVFFFSDLLKIESPANFVFLCILAIVIFRLLTMSVENASLRNKMNQLVQIVALSEACDEIEDGLQR